MPRPWINIDSGSGIAAATSALNGLQNSLNSNMFCPHELISASMGDIAPHFGAAAQGLEFLSFAPKWGQPASLVWLGWPSGRGIMGIVLFSAAIAAAGALAFGTIVGGAALGLFTGAAIWLGQRALSDT